MDDEERGGSYWLVATPPSIATVALVLGGPECVRALC